MVVSLAAARRLAIGAQGLAPAWDLPAGPEGIARTIERLGYVQIDTIAVVERAHHHVLWSRRPDYDAAMLHTLQADQRRVFEYWTHAASYVPMADYRYYLPHMHASAHSGRYHDWLAENAGVVDLVMGRIREEGALGSSDFEAPPDFAGGTWWNWKPAKRALDVLFTCGLLMVSERRNFQRLYDLPERVLPAGVDTREPSTEEVRRFRILGALRAHGLLAQVDLRRPVRTTAHLEETLAAMQAGGEIEAIEIEGLEGLPHYALAGTAADAANLAEADGNMDRVHLLSPFDNLIIDRARLLRLFGFDFAIECYLPAAKRRYGYFNLPILWGDRFAGRLDPKADRQARVLRVRGLTLEPACAGDERIFPPLAEELWQYAAFNGCDEVAVEAEDAPGVAALREAVAAVASVPDGEVAP
jgi:uncharacterized protein YcaQ